MFKDVDPEEFLKASSTKQIWPNPNTKNNKESKEKNSFEDKTWMEETNLIQEQTLIWEKETTTSN